MNYNISAASYRGYGFLDTISKTRAKSMEKLASGYRMNHASDDVASTSITAIMRSQIRGLEQANRNSDDGIALLNSADGGLEAINNILQRIRELAVGAANDTKVEADRKTMQAEVNELLDEIDRIAKSTEFNTIKLLNNAPSTSYTKGRGLRDVVGANNITPDGKLSETYNTWQMLDPTTNGANATNNVYRTEQVTTRTPTSATKTTKYDSFRMKNGGAIYTGKIYDSAGNELGTVSSGKVTQLTSASTTLLPVQSTPVSPVPGPYLPQPNNPAKLYQYTTPNTNPGAPYKDIEKSKTTVAGSSQIYGRDASGNTIALSYNKNDVILESGNTTVEYRDLNEPLHAVSINFIDYNVPGGFTNSDLYNTGFNSTCATCYKHYSLKFVQGTTSKLSGGNNPVLEVAIDSLPANATGADLAKHILDTIKQNPGFSNHFTQYAASGSTLYAFDNRTKPASRLDTFDAMVYGEPTKTEAVTVQLPMKIQSGANSFNVVDIVLPFVSVENMGIDKLDIQSHETASKTIPLVDSALQFINVERSKIGTYVNRLQHVSSIDESAALANTDSESKIHDTEYGSEMLNFTKSRIIEEFGTNSVAEINKMIENVLEFIK